jgi:hypothetical protein
MSRNIIAFSIAIPLCAQLAFADTAPVPISANAAQVCKFTAAPLERSVNNMDLVSSTISDSAVVINNMINSSDAKLIDAAMTIRYRARCNFSHSVKITSQKNGMTDDDAAPYAGSEFLKRVNYTATVIWSGISVELTTDGASSPKIETRSNVNPATGNFDVSLDINGDNNDFNKPVVAGYYTDQITIAIGAGI